MKCSESGDAAKGSRHPSRKTIALDRGSPQQRCPEQAKAAGQRRFAQGPVASLPEALADQDGESSHQRFGANAPSPDLGDGCPEDRPFVVPFWGRGGLAQILQGVLQFRQQGGGATTVQ